MSILPKNEPRKPISQPKNFFIYGKPMTGKSYFASFFPSPLSLNTDDNAEQGTTPFIKIKNLRNENGELKKSSIKQLDKIITELQVNDQGFKTIVIDVVDDIVTLIAQAICIDNKVQSLGDVPYGKGWSEFNTVLQQFVMDLKSLSMNVIYISRELQNVDPQTGEISTSPSLKQKYQNLFEGNCDLVIHTQKFGKDNYTRTITDRRTKYKKENIKDARIKKLLESCKGMFEK